MASTDPNHRVAEVIQAESLSLNEKSPIDEKNEKEFTDVDIVVVEDGDEIRESGTLYVVTK